MVDKQAHGIEGDLRDRVRKPKMLGEAQSVKQGTLRKEMEKKKVEKNLWLSE